MCSGPPRRDRIAARRCRRGARRAAAVAGLALLAALSSGSSALALTQRGHVFSFSFGTPGSGAGQLVSPWAIAVNSANGHVYVADRLGNRVEEFAPKILAGEPVEETFVREVSVPSPEFLAVDNSPGSPSQGDLYVAGTTEARAKKAAKEGTVAADGIVFKFDTEGKPIAELKRFQPPKKKGEEAPEAKFEEIEGLAVDAAGNLYLYDSEGTADVFTNAQPNVGSFVVETSFSQRAPGLALDSGSNLYVGHLSTNLDALGANGEPAVIGKAEHGTGNTLLAEFEPREASGVAVDSAEADEVFIADPAAGSSPGTIAAFTPGGAPIQRFGTGAIKAPRGLAVDPTTHAVYVGDSAAGVVDVFKLEPASGPRVSGLSACETGPEGSSSRCAGAPNAIKLSALVDPTGADTQAYFEYGAAACGSSPGACAKSAPVDLGSGFGDRPLGIELAGLAPGLYHYRAVATSALGSASAERTFTLAAGEAALPDGRQWEMVSPPNKDGGEVEAITREGGTIQAGANGSAISYVTDAPVPAESEPEGNRNLEFTQVISVRGPGGWTSQDIATPHTYGTGVEPGRQEYRSFSTNLALGLVQPFPGITGASALAQPPLSPPEEFEIEGKLVKERSQEKTIYLRDDRPLAPETSAETADFETARHNGETMHNAGFLALVSEADAPGGAKHCYERPAGTPCFGGGRGHGVDVVSGTPDLSHVLLVSEKAAPGLYEWGGEPRLQLVSVLPSGEPSSATVQFAGLHDVRNAVSADGSRVFWGESLGSETHLYLRDTTHHKTVRIDEVAKGASGTGTPAATFQTASSDGSRVFFTDTQRLTPDSKAGEFTGVRKPDLYVFELGGSEAPGCSVVAFGRLCDLTPEGINGESGDVLEQGEVPDTGGGVLAASSDGTSVYFVANAALTEHAAYGNCISKIESVAGRRCNLYVRKFSSGTWGAAKLVAVLANEDSPDWGGSHGGPGELRFVTSRVSPNGRYLAFMSRESLTGYNNEDVTSKAPGERVDEEVFLYDAASERLICASCNPSGARPTGVFDPGQTNEGGAGEGVGLVIDRVGTWESGEPTVDHWLAGSVPGWTSSALATAVYQSRYLSDNGRLFFNSPDQLVPAASGPKGKVFEYEPGHLGGCASEGGCIGLLSSGTSEHESAFLDASEGGNDVFFVTAARLTSQDLDNNFDVYDAHVCEPGSPCITPPAPPPPPCNETPELPCRSAGGPAPSFQAPASASVSVNGNVSGSSGVLGVKSVKPAPKVETKAQKLARALSVCRHRYKRSKAKRKACERAARRRYASKASRSVR